MADRSKMVQIITKGGKVFCVSEIPYPPEVIRGMKKAGYKVKTEERKSKDD